MNQADCLVKYYSKLMFWNVFGNNYLICSNKDIYFSPSKTGWSTIQTVPTLNDPGYLKPFLYPYMPYVPDCPGQSRF